MEYNGQMSKSHNSPSNKKNLTQRQPLTKVARQLASSVTESPFQPCCRQEIDTKGPITLHPAKG